MSPSTVPSEPAIATRPGTTPPTADAAYAHRSDAGTLAAALVDGIGHSPATARLVPLLAEAAARVAATRGGLAGLLTAASLIDPGEQVDAAAVVAVVDPSGGDTIVNWVGDARAYGFDGGGLQQFTTDHTFGRQLSESGVGPEVSAPYGGWLRSSLARAVPATVYEVVIPAGDLIVLTTDGVHDQTAEADLERLVREHAGTPQVLVDALVAAATPSANGSRDDATAVVITTR